MEYDTTDASANWEIKSVSSPSTWTHRYLLQWSSAVYKNYIFLFGGTFGLIFWLDVLEESGNVKCFVGDHSFKTSAFFRGGGLKKCQIC